MRAAQRCSQPGCRNKTKSSTGRCQHHADRVNGRASAPSSRLPDSSVIADWDLEEVLHDNGSVKFRQYKLNGAPSNGPGGEPCWQAWHEDGTRHEIKYCNRVSDPSDGPDGEPASQIWHKNGNLQEVRHLRGGDPCDGQNGEPTHTIWHENGNMKFRLHVAPVGPNGEPSTQWWYEDGSVAEKRYGAGVTNDSPDGEPAWQSFHPNGQVKILRRYRNGVMHDGPGGDAADQGGYEDGSPTKPQHYLNGVQISADDVKWYRQHPDLWRYVAEEHIDHQVAMGAIEDCDGDGDAALLLLRLSE